MKFVPKQEDELQTMSLLEPGIYPFQVSQASDEQSKSGNDMIKLGLSVWGPNAQIYFLYDYLLEAMAYKLRHFCAHTGLILKYEEGELKSADCIGREGYVEIVVQKGKLKENGEYYPNSNKIKDYLARSAYEVQSKQHVEEDLPF